MKLDILIARKDVDILQTTNFLHYDDVSNFTSVNGFNIAVGFTAYDTNTEWILDPTYGELVFNHYSWLLDDDGNISENFTPIKTHNCSKEELGLTEDRIGAKFLPQSEKDKTLMPYVYKKLQCIAKEELWLHGDD